MGKLSIVILNYEKSDGHQFHQYILSSEILSKVALNTITI
jgi:hypothetical protein